MQFPNFLLQMKFPSYGWCVLLLTTFSFYCYRNIFLQSEIGFKLPTINLVSALNNFDVFVVLPSTERFDLYVNLAKTFEAYKDDYLNHYNDYLLLLNSYLILGESQIALKYYAYKYYLNDSYKETDSFVLGSPIVEFNLNFNNPIELSMNREHNLINKHYHHFGIKDNKESCELFFNEYIFPLYQSQSSWKEVEVAKAMSTILNQWTLVKRLQIVCFIGSLILIATSLPCFILDKARPNILLKSIWGYILGVIYFSVFASILALTFACLSITIVTYRSNLNFKGLHNTSFNILQLAWICLIGYASLGWIVSLKIRNDLLDKEKELDNENDSLKGQLLALLKTSINSESSDNEIDLSRKGNEPGGVKAFLNSGINAIKPIVTSVKRLMTPGKELNENEKAGGNSTSTESYHGPTTEDIERIIQYTNNQSVLNTAATNLSKTPPETKNYAQDVPIPSEIKKTPSKDSYTNFKALNVVSAISTSHPDCSPFSKSSTNGSYPDFKFDLRSSGESLSKSLEEKRAGFYHHAGFLLSSKSDGDSALSHKIPGPETSSQMYYKKNSKSPLARSSMNSGHMPDDFNTKSDDSNANSCTTTPPDTNIEWEKKFGLSRSSASAETGQVVPVRQNLSIHSNPSLRRNVKDQASSRKLASEGSIRSDPEKTKLKMDVLKVKGKNKYEFFLPSTGGTSEYTEGSVADEEGTKISSKAEEIHSSTAPRTADNQQESIFSIDRIVREQTLK